MGIGGTFTLGAADQGVNFDLLASKLEGVNEDEEEEQRKLQEFEDKRKKHYANEF